MATLLNTVDFIKIDQVVFVYQYFKVPDLQKGFDKLPLGSSAKTFIIAIVIACIDQVW